MVAISATRRHLKGLSTLLLVLLAETISISDAVTPWKKSNSRTEKAKNFSPFGSLIAERIQKVQDCADSTTHCVSQKPSLSTISLSPRARLRLKSSMKNFSEDDYCRECVNHCAEDLSSESFCDIRGGHSSVPLDNAADVTAKTFAAVSPYGIPLNGWKIIFQAILTFINVAFWLLPLKSKKMSENKLALSLANAFSGGVFLSLAFGHLLPECTHGFHGMNEATPYMLALGGYMLIFMVEKVIFDTEHILPKADGQIEKNGNETISPGSGRGAVILLGALAVHSILEMTALGLADTFGDSALLTLSIALHQPAESIALLVAFIKSGLPENEIIKYLSIFSAMGPIGVALGMAVNEFAAPIVDAIMLAVVAGTFVYVGATEVIPEEFEDPENKWKKFLALVSGIISIFAITQYTMTLETQ